jgi:GNAT superfamily N-acetyltransferase
VLQAGLREQSLVVRRTEPGRQEYQREHLARVYDEATNTFLSPETWHVAVDDGRIIGVLRIMAETHTSEPLYREHGFLLIQEFDAYPERRGAGQALLEEAKKEAARRGGTAIVLQTPTGSEAHMTWYPARGFQSWPDGDNRQMSGMILYLGDNWTSPDCDDQEGGRDGPDLARPANLPAGVHTSRVLPPPLSARFGPLRTRSHRRKLLAALTCADAP